MEAVGARLLLARMHDKEVESMTDSRPDTRSQGDIAREPGWIVGYGPGRLIE
jgi:hypothetical protein